MFDTMSRFSKPKMEVTLLKKEGKDIPNMAGMAEVICTIEMNILNLGIMRANRSLMSPSRLRRSASVSFSRGFFTTKNFI